MTTHMPELLSPAGNMEKLKAALRYGADAVYLAADHFGMRAGADNFTLDELPKACEETHKHGKKLYLTLNTMPREDEYPQLRLYMQHLRTLPMDAYLVADSGVLMLLKEIIPDAVIHISTQANTVSSAAARAWQRLGAKRVVLARELTLSEISEIRRNIPDTLELECFVHGSMCISYSGRCLLSNYLTGRDGNRGQCAQPCRWNYVIYEEKRPQLPLPLEQDLLGTYVMSSKDLCMIEHIPELMESGITSFKIEGRMKSAYYAAVITNAYRMAMDAYAADPTSYRFDPRWLSEVESVSHREYGTGYFFDHCMQTAQTVTQTGYLREKAYLATALEYDETRGQALFFQRNKLSVGMQAELITPGQTGRALKVKQLFDETGTPIDAVPHPKMHFWMPVPFEVKPGDILRA